MNDKNIKLLSGAILFTLLVGLASCGNKANKPSNVDNLKIDTNYTVSYPSKVSGALHNKGMGWITLEEQTELGKLDLGANGDLVEVDNVGIQTCWDLLEPEEGKFNFDLVDETIEYWTKRGKRINLRICTDSLSLPEVFLGAPRWLNEEPYNVDYYEYQYSGNIMARVNNLLDKNYQFFFERFMSELANRYSNNPYLDSVDIRGYGMYGEWHSGYNFNNMEERIMALAYVVDKYAKYFAKEGIDVFLSNSWEYQGSNKDGTSASFSGNCNYLDYLRWSAFDSAVKLEYIGFRRDGMAGNGVTKYSTDERALSELIYSGKRAVNCGEYFQGFNSYVNEIYGMDPIEATEELFFKSRANYATAMGWVNSEVARIIASGYEEVFNRGNELMGYRLKVDSVQYPRGIKPGNTVYVKSKLSNSGVGKFNEANHTYQLMLIDNHGNIAQTINNENYDLRTLLNGETLNIYSEFKANESLKDGKYTLACAIVDANNNPSIRLAQVGNYDDKIYPLGVIEVGNYKQVKKFYQEMSYDEAKKYKLDANSNYEITIDYTPKVKLSDYTFGDENSFHVDVVAKNKATRICDFKDVSEIRSYKTITSPVFEKKSTINIYGTGIYENNIEINNVIIENKTGYLEGFENNYNLLSVNSPWYSDNGNAYLSTSEEALTGNNSIIIYNDISHTATDGLYSDPKLLNIKANTSYTLSFKEKGYEVGGNAAYYYVKLYDDKYNEYKVCEWYDRVDDPLSVKSFTFITPDATGLYLAFGVKNSGAYIIDDINIVANYSGVIVNGNDVKNENNVIPVNKDKLDENFVEGFEDYRLADCKFMSGFNRWGHLTNDESEVISGKYSFSSKLDPMTYSFFKDSNWFEFMYSNPKYVKLEANTKYVVTFKYKIMDEIVLNTDSSTPGYAYILARSENGNDKDSDVLNFAKNIEVNKVYDLSYEFTTNNAMDYKVIVGIYGVGNLIIDDIVVKKA